MKVSKSERGEKFKPEHRLMPYEFKKGRTIAAAGE